MTVPAWIVDVLEKQCSTQCLDTPEERAVVAEHIYRRMVGGDEPDDELCTRDLAERVVQGRNVTTAGHLEIAMLLLAITGPRK